MLVLNFKTISQVTQIKRGSETKFETKQINLGKVGKKHSSITMHDMEIADLFQIQGT